MALYSKVIAHLAMLVKNRRLSSLHVAAESGELRRKANDM